MQPDHPLDLKLAPDHQNLLKVKKTGDTANSENTQWVILFQWQQSNHRTHHTGTSRHKTRQN